MRISSGVITRSISFVAVDSTDFTTRETGLTGFTVYRSRDGSTPVLMTTPTVTELSSANTPGVYSLLLDEDMTILSGADNQEMTFHITASGMAPVTRTIELYRPKITLGQTLTVDSGIGQSSVQSIVANAINAASIATGALTAAKFAAGAFDAVWTVTARILTAATNITSTGGTTVPQTGDAFARVGAPVGASISVDLASVKSDVTGIKGATFDTATDSLEAIRNRGDAEWITGGAGSAPTVDEIADAVWDEAISAHLTAGSTGAALNAAGGSGDPWVTVLPGSYTAGQAGGILAAILTDTAELQGNQGDWATATGFATPTSVTDARDEVQADIADLNNLSAAQVNAEVDSALSDYDAPTKAELDAGIATISSLDAAGVRAAVGLSSADLDSQLSAVPTAIENADTLLNRDMSDVSDTNSRTPLNALRLMRNRWGTVGTTLTVRKEDDSTVAWTSVVTGDAAADPIVGSDPA